VALKQDADRLPAHLRRQFPLHRFGGDQPHAPPRPALWRRTAHHGDDPLALAYVQRSLFAGPRLFVQCRLQPFLLIMPGSSWPCEADAFRTSGRKGLQRGLPRHVDLETRRPPSSLRPRRLNPELCQFLLDEIKDGRREWRVCLSIPLRFSAF
jgi:hypothetical protein